MTTEKKAEKETGASNTSREIEGKDDVCPHCKTPASQHLWSTFDECTERAPRVKLLGFKRTYPMTSDAHVGESVGTFSARLKQLHVEVDFEKLGFKIEETGGGCQWLRLQINEKLSLVITDGEAGLPSEQCAQLFVMCGNHSDAIAQGEAMTASALVGFLRASGIGLKQFKVTSTTKVCREPFVDWYEAATASEAIALAKDDAHRYGLPANTTF